jgi:PEP-CTERM motif
MTVILSGIVCTNTCIGYTPGDDTPDYLALFGPPFGQLGGQQFTLTPTTLTIDGHSVTLDADHTVSFTSPLLASFGPGSAVFTATGFNPFGFAVAETEFLCPVVTGVPEPSTVALMLVGGAFLAMRAKKRRRPT